MPRTQKTAHRSHKTPTPSPLDFAQRASMALGLGADFENRRIYLFGEIATEIAYRFLVNLHTMDQTKGEITVFINSEGGGAESGYSIYEALRMARNPTIGVGLGGVQSIAAIIMQGVGTRLLTPECRVMVHDCSLELGPVTSNTLLAVAKDVAYSNDRYHKILSSRTGIPLGKMTKLCRRETYFTAEEAVKAGFADGIVQYDLGVITLEDIQKKG